jgi:hypothetical protein
MSVFPRVLAIIIAASSVILAVEAMAQVQPPPAGQKPRTPGAATPAPREREVEGQIKSVDRREVTLTDGTRFVIPPGAMLPPDVKEGSIIVARYMEEAGEKVLTGIGVQPSAAPRAAPPASSPPR